MHKDIKLIKEYISRKSTYAIIPITWNEGEKIAQQIDRMQSIIDYADIIIADNASDDGSLADEFLQSKNIRAKVISSARGYGNALRPAISYALDQGYEGIITIDGNNKDGPEALIEMTEYLKQGYGFIQASRSMKDGTQKNMPLDRLLAVKLFMIPLFTIASGLIGFNLLIFILVSLISRSMRFFIIAYLSFKFGDLFTEFMDKNGSKWFTVLGLLLILIFVIIFLFFKFNN